MRGLRLLTVALTLLLGACTNTTPPPQGGSIDLEGLWLVTPALGTAYGSGGTTTLEIGDAPSGSATFLSRATDSGVTTCESHVYAAVTSNVVVLNDEHYLATRTGQDRIDLVNELSQITLTRITGTAPVAPCAEAQAVQVGTLASGPGSFSTLDSFQTRLYFNTNDTDRPVVAFDTVTGLFGAGRVYTGAYKHVVAARNDTEFYGHCACGNLTTLQRFDIDTDTALATVTSDVDLGLFMTLERGVFTGSVVMVTGTTFDEPARRTVVSLDPDTLALVGQRDILPGAFPADLAWNGTKLAALLSDSIVIVGVDGLAESTISLEGTLSDFPVGLTFAAGKFYILDRTVADQTAIYRVDLE